VIVFWFLAYFLVHTRFYNKICFASCYFVISVVHTEPKANTNKTQTSRFMWFFKTRYVHGDSRLYIIEGMIQTLNSTRYNPSKPSVSLLHLVFLSNLLFLTLKIVLALTAHTSSTSCTIAFSLSPFIGEMRVLVATNKKQTTPNYYNKYSG